MVEVENDVAKADHPGAQTNAHESTFSSHSEVVTASLAHFAGVGTPPGYSKHWLCSIQERARIQLHPWPACSGTSDHQVPAASVWSAISVLDAA